MAVADALGATSPVIGDSLDVPGVTARQVGQALRRLGEEHIHVKDDGGSLDGGDGLILVLGLTPQGLREIGDWPSPEDPIGSLVAALTAAAARTSDPDERSRLQRAVAAVGGLVGTVATEVIKAHAVAIAGPH